jgi:nucleotide-binding universal stress UspA family protein
MSSFAKILVPTDFSDSAELALDQAIALAEPFGGTLTLLHVYEVPVMYPSWPGGLALSAEILTSTEKAAEASLTKWKAMAEKRLAQISDRATAKISAKLVCGSARDEIIAEAEQGAYDLIVIGTHGRTGLSHVLLGSVAERVVRVAPCPVLTVRPIAEAARTRHAAASGA